MKFKTIMIVCVAAILGSSYAFGQADADASAESTDVGPKKYNTWSAGIHVGLHYLVIPT